MNIRIAGVVKNSIVDGPGLRYVLFMQGCRRRCVGCHNPQTHDLNGGFLVDTDKILNEIFQDPLISGVTFSGGEPFVQDKELEYIICEIKKHRPELNLIIYTGYAWGFILKIDDWRRIAGLVDIIVDRPFEKELIKPNLKFRGSSNQRVIDTKLSFEKNDVVCVDW